jgi:phasin
MENAYRTAAKAIWDYNFKALEIASNNSDATFGYAQQLMSAKSPSEMLELWTTHMRKQFKILSEQTKELAMLGQKVVTETAEPLMSGISKTYKKAA